MHEQLRVTPELSSETSVHYPKAPEWSHVAPDSPDYVAKVQASPLGIQAKTIHPVALEVQALNFKGEPLGDKTVQSIQFKPEQDVVDTLFWYRGLDGEPRLVAWEKIRAPLAIRSTLDVPHLVAENGMQLNLPGSYFIEDSATLAVGDVVRKCANEMGLEIKGPIRLLGGSYSTTPDSPELVFPRMVEVHHPGWEGVGPTSIGQAFSGRMTLRSFKPGEIANDFLRSGAIGATDLRHVLADLRFVAKNNEKLALDADKHIHPTHWQSGKKIPLILSRKAIRSLPANYPQICAELKKQEVQPAQSEQTVRAERYRANNLNSNGKPIESYEFDAIIRDKIDFLGNLPWFIDNGKLFIGVNIGVRPAQTHRNSIAHPVYTEISPLSVEGLFCGLKLGVSSRELNSKAAELLSDSGFCGVSNPLYFGSGTLSSGYDMGVFHLFAQEIDPTQTIIDKLPPGTFFVNTEDILALADTSEVKSLDLISAVLLLRARLGMSLRPSQDMIEDSKQSHLLEKILSNPSRALTKLAKSMPQVFELLQGSVEGRKFLNYLDNEAEITLVDSKHPDEKGLFDGVLRISPRHSAETEAEPGLNFHDALGHFIRKRVPVPIGLDETGKVKFWPYKAFRDAILIDEADALWLSDVKVPQAVGIEEYDRSTGKLHLAGFLRKAGIVGIAAEQKAVRDMVLHGKLPRELAEHEDYPLYRSEIMNKFLGYYVRDGMMNCRKLYKAWLKKPEQARIISLFIPHMEATVAKEWLQGRGGFGSILKYAHGRNPLKGFISDIRGEGTSRTLAQLAALGDKFSANGAQPDQELYRRGLELAEGMSFAFAELEKLRSQVKDVEKSQANLEILNRVLELRREYYKPAMKFCFDHWPKGEREFPAAIIHPFFAPKNLDRWMVKVERKNLQGTINEHLVGEPCSY